MVYNKKEYGKIKSIDYKLGIGEIITPQDIFMFIIDPKENLEIGDLVSFRAENIRNANKAFFVKKLQ